MTRALLHSLHPYCKLALVINRLLTTTVQLSTINQVKTVYDDNVMNNTNVYKWYRDFKNGRTSMQDNETSRRP